MYCTYINRITFQLSYLSSKYHLDFCDRFSIVSKVSVNAAKEHSLMPVNTHDVLENTVMIKKDEAATAVISLLRTY